MTHATADVLPCPAVRMPARRAPRGSPLAALAVLGRRLLLAAVLPATLALPAVAPAAPQGDGAGTPAYRLGVFPYMAPRQTLEFYGPVAASMQTALGRPVKLESVRSFPDYAAALAARRYDIALVQPFDYHVAVEQHGYLPLAQLSVPLVSQFYVRDDSPYRRLEDLRGTLVAMPPPETANARMTLRALHDHGLLPGRDLQLRYFSSHDACLQQVWAGTASACGTARPPVRVFEQRMQARLRAIHDTAPVPHIAFMVQPRVPPEDRAALQALIVGWSGTEAGRKLLGDLGFPGFVVARPADYEVMRGYDPVPPEAAAFVRPLGDQLVLGVFPYLTPRQLAEHYAAALPRLGQAAGRPVQLRSAQSFGNFIEGVTRAEYDVIVVQPFDYGVASRSGYLPLAAMTQPLEGTFFVRADGPVRQVADLRGRPVAMPPREAAQSRIALRALARAGLDPGRDVTVDHRPTHGACLQQVQTGQAAACATAPFMLGLVPPALSAGLRAVGQSDAIPGLIFLAHTRVPADLRQRLAEEISGWGNDAAGRAVLERIGLGPFGPADVAAYERLQADEGRR